MKGLKLPSGIIRVMIEKEIKCWVFIANKVDSRSRTSILDEKRQKLPVRARHWGWLVIPTEELKQLNL